MARGGVTQTEVADARQRILVRGENPSIDAIRVELGHTGSKTTISRHVKVIEAYESTRMDDEALLSSHIKNLVGQLAQQLQAEAKGTVQEAEQRHQTEIDRLKTALKRQSDENSQLKTQNEALRNTQSELESTVAEFTDSLNDLKGELRAQKQHVDDLVGQVKDKQSQVDSLEDKHRHAREALAHYRASVKEQRDQDRQQHEHQIQQHQAELRQLKQTVAVKQEEMTQATRETTRLFAELTEVRKYLMQGQKDLQQEQHEHRLAIEECARLKLVVSQLQENAASTESLTQEITELKNQVNQITSELNIKNAVLAQLRPDTGQQTEAIEPPAL